jgi:DNA-directed RNA polymerase specialized sigma24 family protein
MSPRLDPDFLALVAAHEEELLRAARLLTGDWERAEKLLRDALAWALAGWELLADDPAAGLRIQQRLIADFLSNETGARADAHGDSRADAKPPATGAEAGARPDAPAGAEWAAASAQADAWGDTEPPATGAEAGARPDAPAGAEWAAAGAQADAWADAEWAAAGAPVDGGTGRGIRGQPAGSRPALVEALAGLPPDDRAVVVSRYYLGLSPAEIGEILGIGADRVSAVAARALAVLRWGQ